MCVSPAPITARNARGGESVERFECWGEVCAGLGKQTHGGALRLIVKVIKGVPPGGFHFNPRLDADKGIILQPPVPRRFLLTLKDLAGRIPCIEKHTGV